MYVRMYIVHIYIYITHAHSLFGSIKPWGLRIPSGIIVFADKSLSAKAANTSTSYKETYVCIYIYIWVYIAHTVRPSTGSCQQRQALLIVE